MKKYPYASLALTITALAAIALMPAGALAQKPAHVKLNSLLSRIPIPQSSAACYATCTTTTDASGVTSIKDLGPAFTTLQDELKSLMMADMSAMNNPAAPKSTPQAPTADEIAKMQADAMAKAQAYQQGGGANTAAMMQAQAQAHKQATAPSKANLLAMQNLNKAGEANQKIQSMLMEVRQKMVALHKEEPQIPPNCPEVRQGSYVGPTCACEYARGVTAEKNRVTVMDHYIQQRSAIIRNAIGQIQVQLGIVDQLMEDTKYGDAITDPTLLQLLWSAQRQAMSGVVEMLGASSGAWTDGSNTYLSLVNAQVNHCK
ncbi:MAG: hypothetical protein Q8932_06555 [Bacteroidota bacterium]|nr:hypothetical protein [Bacteroidota bacterium]